jgi:hypothetical protein
MLNQETTSLMFNTEMRDLYSNERHPDLYGEFITKRASDYQGVFRTDTDDCLGIFKENSYTLVQNDQFFSGIEDQLTDYFDPIVMDTMKVKDSASHHGAVSIREYHFPSLAKTIETNRHKTSLNFRVIGWNCFDGSSRCKIIIGNIDTFCSNGLISGDYDTSSQKRTSGFDLRSFIGKVSTGLVRFDSDITKFQRYAESTVLTPYVNDFFNNLKGISERNAERLQSQYMDEVSVRGNNLWAVVSTLTNYASHFDGRFPTRNTGNNHDGVTSFNRQAQVGRWLNSDTFKTLERHAVAV